MHNPTLVAFTPLRASRQTHRPTFSVLRRHNTTRTLKLVVGERPLLYGWGSRTALPHGTRTAEGMPAEAVLSPSPLFEEGSDRDTLGVITHIAAGWAHSLVAFKSEATGASCIRAVGLNMSGQLGIGSRSTEGHEEGAVRELPDNAEVMALSCGREHSMILMSLQDGTSALYACGNAMYGQLGLGTSKIDVPGLAARIVYEDVLRRVGGYEGRIGAVACGMDHTVFLTDKNKLYAMGWGADGQLGLGNGSTSDRSTPSLIAGLDGRRVRKLASSTDFTMALLDEGELWTWGNSEYGQCMHGKKINRVLEPTRVPTAGHTVVDVAAGGPFSLFLTVEGDVYTCGYGALGLGPSATVSLTPKRIDGLEKMSRVFATTDYAATITESGRLYTWGLGGSSAPLGLGGSERVAFVPRLVRFPEGVRVIEVALGVGHGLAVCRREE